LGSEDMLNVAAGSWFSNDTFEDAFRKTTFFPYPCTTFFLVKGEGLGQDGESQMSQSRQVFSP